MTARAPATGALAGFPRGAARRDTSADTSARRPQPVPLPHAGVSFGGRWWVDGRRFVGPGGLVAFNASVRDTLVSQTITAPDTGRFRADLVAADVSRAARVVVASIGPLGARRGRDQARRAEGSVFLLACDRGRGEIRHRGGVEAIAPGRLVVVPGAEPFDVTYPVASRVVFVALPQTEVATRYAALTGRFGHTRWIRWHDESAAGGASWRRWPPPWTTPRTARTWPPCSTPRCTSRCGAPSGTRPATRWWLCGWRRTGSSAATSFHPNCPLPGSPKVLACRCASCTACSRAQGRRSPPPSAAGV